MKFGTCLLNSLMRFLLAGLLFINAIPPREEINLYPQGSFIGIQGYAFNVTASTVMPAINVVALASNSFLTKYHLKENFTLNKLTPKSTVRFLIFCPK